MTINPPPDLQHAENVNSCLVHGLLAGITVLLVDDHPEEVRLLAEMLHRAEARVLLATDGDEAVRLAVELQPSLILLDVTLPPANGFAVCSELHRMPTTREIPVLFLSGRTDTDTKLQGFAAGGRDYIVKPFIEAEVMARVALHIDLARRLPTFDMGSQQADPEASLVKVATDLLLQDLTVTPKLTDLARMAGTNPRRLNEAFRSHLGLSVLGFLRESRLKEAYRLLLDTDLSIQQVGGRVGYPLAANFSTSFRERFGVSPRQLRREPHTHE